jgi:threonylcarbamoyladenosine tRNA methylthiotransferase MtaB
MKIALETLGCKLNQAETETLARQFTQAGHELVTRVEDADIYILNTCTVTHTADSKSRHLISQTRRRNPTTRIVVTGCYADRAPLDLAKLEMVDLITGNEDKMTLLERLKDEGFLINTGSSPFLSTNHTLRTRTFIKIQDGCRNYCAYCIVPYVRRVEKSIPPDEVIRQVKQRVAEDYQEVVLTGTRIGAYDSHGLQLKDLIERILSETRIPRLRLSSLQPQEISLELLGLWRDNRLCPHFHLSLQSGSDSILKRMHRRYTAEEFQKTVTLIRAMVPKVAITTDVIVGFPGETDEEFQASLDLCNRLNFARIHVFPFSPRSGTEAAQMSGQISSKDKKERTRIMLALAEDSLQRFRKQFAGDELDVLWEKQTGQGVWSGVTGNYLRVIKHSDKNISNQIENVKMSE